jgi:hypothetical protein
MFPPTPLQNDHADVRSFRDEVLAVYEALDQEIASLGPNCQLSGRCCRFKEYGHTLFVSGPEFAVLLDGAPAPSRPIDDGETCPWQNLQGRCTARGARPLGCRVYFCDPQHEPRAPEISERYLAELKRLAERHGLAWRYAPLHHHTRHAENEGMLGRIDQSDNGVPSGDPSTHGETRRPMPA